MWFEGLDLSKMPEGRRKGTAVRNRQAGRAKVQEEPRASKVTL